MNAATDLWTMAVIVGLAGVTVLTRCFFFILDRPWSLPPWADRALQYAPVAPEVVMQAGHFVETWRDARLFAGPAGALIYYWRRSVLMTIAGGMAVYLPLHLGLGW